MYVAGRPKPLKKLEELCPLRNRKYLANIFVAYLGTPTRFNQ